MLTATRHPLTAGRSAPYRGRFAPSPTGPLHFGSLVTAVGSYLDARKAGGQWLVRIDDIDPPREIPGSADSILATLERFGFEWDGPVLRQSSRTDACAAAISRLLANGQAFECTCSRTEIEAATPDTRCSEEARYPGWCRRGVRAPGRSRAIRIVTAPGIVTFLDRIQGRIEIDVAAEVGDFVVRRRDGLYAYQLAAAVDDDAQNITHVVRGADLLHSTSRQIVVQRALALPSPEYAHLPVVTDCDGVKLSKSAGAAALDAGAPAMELWRALRFLRQIPPPELQRATTGMLWEWAIERWQTAPLQGLRQDVIDTPAPQDERPVSD